MRFLFTLHNFYPEPIFGAEKVCVLQMRELIRKGHDVALFYACNRPFSDVTAKKTGLEKLKCYRVRFLNTRGQVLLSTWKPFVSRKFHQALKECKPDIIVFHHLVRLSADLPLVGKKANIPMLYYLHDFYPVCPSYSLLDHTGNICHGGGLFKCPACLFYSRFQNTTLRLFQTMIPAVLAALPFMILRNIFFKKAARSINGFISPSGFLLHQLERQGFKPAYDMVIPYGSDIKQSIERKKIRPPIRFGYLGNVIPKKGIDTLVKAFRGTLAQQLTIRGFPDKAAVEKFRNRYPDFSADLEIFDDNKDSFYKNIDVIIVPSIWYENQPMVIIEAFGYGKPVICSDLGGMSEMVKENRGILFKPGNADDLRAKIEYLNRHPDELNRLADNIPLWPDVGQNVDKLIHVAKRCLEK